MATAQELLQNTANILEPFAGLWASVETSKAEAEKLQYTAELEALRAQVSTPEYEAQDIDDRIFSAGMSVPSGVLWPWVGLGILGLYLFAKK